MKYQIDEIQNLFQAITRFLIAVSSSIDVIGAVLYGTPLDIPTSPKVALLATTVDVRQPTETSALASVGYIK